jgi:hypothetical protein
LPVARPVGVMHVNTMRDCGYCFSSASTSGSAARVSPTETACTQMVDGSSLAARLP